MLPRAAHQDVISDTGGSAAYGGPVSSEGRLLMRERVMLSLGTGQGVVEKVMFFFDPLIGW